MALPRYVSFKEVVDALPYSGVHIRRLIAAGDFPEPVKLSERRTAFAEQDILDWLESKAAGRSS